VTLDLLSFMVFAMVHDHSSPGIEGQSSRSDFKNQGQRFDCSCATLPMPHTTMGRICRYGGLGLKRSLWDIDP